MLILFWIGWLVLDSVQLLLQLTHFNYYLLQKKLELKLKLEFQTTNVFTFECKEVQIYFFVMSTIVALNVSDWLSWKV